MIVELNKWLEHWEPIWLFLILAVEAVVGIFSAYILVKEYKYDEMKDLAKSQRKTRTSKKTTQSKDGGTTVEETVETTEPIQNEGTKGESK
jgi:hypothetical protein